MCEIWARGLLYVLITAWHWLRWACIDVVAGSKRAKLPNNWVAKARGGLSGSEVPTKLSCQRALSSYFKCADELKLNILRAALKLCKLICSWLAKWWQEIPAHTAPTSPRGMAVAGGGGGSWPVMAAGSSPHPVLSSCVLSFPPPLWPMAGPTRVISRRPEVKST